MTTDKFLFTPDEIGGDWFRFIYSRNGKYTIKHYLNFFNKDDYYIYKKTRKQREVTYEDFLKFEYSGYIFFRKDLYKREDINKWIYFIGQFGGMMYIDKPFPKIEIMNKIKIKK